MSEETREEACARDQREHGDKPCRACHTCCLYYREQESEAVFQVSRLEAELRELQPNVVRLVEIENLFEAVGPYLFEAVRKAKMDAARTAELEGRHGVAPMAVACGLEPDATLDELYERMQSLVASEGRVTELEARQTVCPECGKAQRGRLKILRSYPSAARCQHCGFVAWTRSRGVEMVRPDQPEKEKPNGRD